VLTKGNKCPNQEFYLRLFDLQTIWAKYGLETWFSPNDDIRICLIDMKNGSTKNAFWDVKKNDVNGVRLFHLSYLITLMAYKWSRWTPNVHIKNFMFHWSIYGLFVLNRGWKRECFQIKIFVIVCSTCSIVQLKTRFEKWITINDVTVVSLFHLSYLITRRDYLYS
jgi:hypothetical protein